MELGRRRRVDAARASISLRHKTAAGCRVKQTAAESLYYVPPLNCSRYEARSDVGVRVGVRGDAKPGSFSVQSDRECVQGELKSATRYASVCVEGGGVVCVRGGRMGKRKEKKSYLVLCLYCFCFIWGGGLECCLLNSTPLQPQRQQLYVARLALEKEN